MSTYRDPDFGWYSAPRSRRHWTHLGAWLAQRRARRGKR